MGFQDWMLRRIIKHFRKEKNVQKLLEWLLKVKFLEGHRRQVGIGLMAASAGVTALLHIAPVVATFVPQAAAAVPVLGAAGVYLGIVGAAYQKDYGMTPGEAAKQPAPPK